ncbi:hypothetical protein M422DRAFT_48567 [Sphaerobolus stellatus SS14]|uniref:Unplaced genomic scaffold SPHSTscaffold_61, whole genome shotgun sequence n=1 Tax=Sphaerobolus stellatus (strain SS14) TaxID=990650 RepID=A0A0C9VIW8_SPHS4|nr:hypothetical protein M422DRAFT_48567 [Sphaerobolus stellatus SS14]
MATHASESLRLVTTLSRIAAILLETLVAMVTSLSVWVQHRQLKLLRVTTGEGSFTELVLQQGLLTLMSLPKRYLLGSRKCHYCEGDKSLRNLFFYLTELQLLPYQYERPIIVSIDLGYQNATCISKHSTPLICRFILDLRGFRFDTAENVITRPPFQAAAHYPDALGVRSAFIHIDEEVTYDFGGPSLGGPQVVNITRFDEVDAGAGTTYPRITVEAFPWAATTFHELVTVGER